MSNIYGALGFTDRDTTVDFVGQNSVYDLVNRQATMYEMEVNKLLEVFVEDEDWGYLEKVKLPGGGAMQESDRLAVPGATKRTGGYDVAYPIYDGRDSIAWDDVSYAYMTIVELDSHLTTIENRMLNWKRAKVLRALFNNVNEVVSDERWGSITVRRLANNDTQADGSATLYPPLIGQLNEASGVTKYQVAGYITSAITAVNNPFPVIKEQFEQHFGEGNLVTFINNADTPYVRALAGFVPATYMHQLPGIGVTTYQGITDTVGSRLDPDKPGKLIGTINDIEIREYRYVPAGYFLTVDEAQDAPLRRRVDQPVQLRGFQLYAQNMDMPFMSSYWRLREGYGVRNRLNGHIMQFKAAGNYDIPAQYV